MGNKQLTPIPGLHRVVERRESSLATKVTGRHMGAVNYLASLSAERRGERLEVISRYLEDGSLELVKIQSLSTTISLLPGDYIYLHPESQILTYSGGEYYEWVYERLEDK